MCIVQLDIKVVIDTERNDFAKRLTALRMAKGVSSREMSLSLGQSPGYINNIENGVNYPSMTVFFYICEYLGISPKEFFDTENNDPQKSRELMEVVKGLNSEQQEHLIALAKALK